MFNLAAHEREQNFGFLVSRPQTGHTATAILSESWFNAGRACIKTPVSSQFLVQRLYGHRLNQDGKAKIQSSPRTLKGGNES